MSSHRAFMERWFHELWTERNARIIDECVSEDCVILGAPDVESGSESFHSFFEGFGEAFPKVEVRVEDCISEGESFAIRCSGYAHDHDGNMHAFSGAVLGKIRGGQIVEAFNQWDFPGILDALEGVEDDMLDAAIAKEALH